VASDTSVITGHAWIGPLHLSRPGNVQGGPGGEIDEQEGGLVVDGQVA
jgi:hypothetical protein